MTEEETGIIQEEIPSIRPYGYRDFLLNLRQSVHEFPKKTLSMAALITMANIIPICTGSVLYGAGASAEFALYTTLALVPIIVFHKEIFRGVRGAYHLVRR